MPKIKVSQRVLELPRRLTFAHACTCVREREVVSQVVRVSWPWLPYQSRVPVGNRLPFPSQFPSSGNPSLQLPASDKLASAGHTLSRALAPGGPERGTTDSPSWSKAISPQILPVVEHSQNY